MTVEDELRVLAAEALHIPPDRLAAGSSLSRDHRADSLLVIELAYLIEKRYDINLDSAHLDLLDSVESAASYVESILSMKNGVV